jgi:hypothetical protein
VNLEAYLISKKIDSGAFRKAEPELWEAWSNEFEQMHPNSFTLQKLNLINPIRRKYPLPIIPQKQQETPATGEVQPPAPPMSESKVAGPPSPSPKPSIPKPVFKPKPKMS